MSKISITQDSATAVSMSRSALFIITPDGIESPEHLAGLAAFIKAGKPVIVWRPACVADLPIPTMLDGYHDLKGFEGDYQDIKQPLLDYMHDRGFITEEDIAL